MKETKFAGINRRAARGFSWLIAVLLIFTVVSRVADSFLVPQVVVEQPSPKIIEHLVEVVGSVEKKEEFPVLTEAGILVENVCVQEGDFAAEGDVLARFAEEHLAEQIAALENEIAVLVLTNEAIETNAAQDELEREEQRRRAEEDYARIVKQQETAVGYAQMELEASEDAIEHFSELNGQSAQGELDALWQTYFAKKAAYGAALLAQETAVTAAERAIEDAKSAARVDNTAKINRISIEEKKKVLDVLVELQDSRGEIRAPKAGTVTGIFVQTGQKTTDTAAFTMASTGDGIRFFAEIAREDAAYVQIGDAVSVKKNGGNYDGSTVADIEIKKDGGLMIWVEDVSGAQADFTIGEAVTLTITQQSERYPLAVPLTALHVETQGTYVYVLREEETVLGRELFAEKVPVKVLEKNGNYAALEEGTLGMESRVIVDSDRYVEAGSRVRLSEGDYYE